MLAILTLSYLVAAIFYAALGLWRATIEGLRKASLLLGMAFAGMALWSFSVLLTGGAAPIILETLRNLLWIVYLGFFVRRDRAITAQGWFIGLPYLLIGLAVLRAAMVVCFLLWGARTSGWTLPLAAASSVGFCVGALIFLHSLYLAVHRAASGFRLILFGLAVLWGYDLNLYAGVLLEFRMPAILADGRGLVLLALAPIFALAARRKESWAIGLSRKVALQSLSMVAIGGYFVLVSMIASARPWLSNVPSGAVQIAVGIAATIGVIVLFGSPRARARVRVALFKHLFKHRYDYRAEWLRFNATMNGATMNGATMNGAAIDRLAGAAGDMRGAGAEERAVKALADLMEAGGGRLFLRTGPDRLTRAALFGAPAQLPEDGEIVLPAALRRLIEDDSHVMINPRHDAEQDAAEFPAELAADPDAWLAVPLVRMGVLIGLVALDRPSVVRLLDWEDIDLLKVLGQQIATYITDSQRQAELEEARRFEEFNRRFAYIVHDLKNVVSQLSLVAENAEVHGANPRFQADMAATLRNAAKKMTGLLARLSAKQHDADPQLAPVDAAALLDEIATARRRMHPVHVELGTGAEMGAHILADREKLHTAIDHLVQNAIEASEPGEPIRLTLRVQDDAAILSVLDAGTGMSPDFVRAELFKPFASTKQGGFGIGAGEARALIRQMGGELVVQSIERVGSSFAITLPLVTDGPFVKEGVR